jgi:hypothetical protein
LLLLVTPPATSTPNLVPLSATPTTTPSPILPSVTETPDQQAEVTATSEDQAESGSTGWRIFFFGGLLIVALIVLWLVAKMKR